MKYKKACHGGSSPFTPRAGIASTMCPVLEMGKNSVSPSTIPRTAARRISSTSSLRKRLTRGHKVSKDAQGRHDDGQPDHDVTGMHDPGIRTPRTDCLHNERDGDALHDHLDLPPVIAGIGRALRSRKSPHPA